MRLYYDQIVDFRRCRSKNGVFSNKSLNIDENRQFHRDIISRLIEFMHHRFQGHD